MGGGAIMFRRFFRDQQGVALVLVTVMLPVLMGFALLVIDRSRAFNLHSDLQKAADALALAGAAELDGKPDALTRSDNALQFLVSNQSRFSDEGTQTVSYLPTDATDVDRRFLSTIPASDADPIEESNVTTDPAAAVFIEITVKPVGFDSIFPASLLGAIPAKAETVSPHGCKVLQASARHAAEAIESLADQNGGDKFRASIPYLPESVQSAALAVEERRKASIAPLNDYAQALRDYADVLEGCSTAP